MLLDFARSIDAELRFIESMDVGGATQWSPEQVVSRAQVLTQVTVLRGFPVLVAGRGSAPAERFSGGRTGPAADASSGGHRTPRFPERLQRVTDLSTSASAPSSALRNTVRATSASFARIRLMMMV